MTFLTALVSLSMIVAPAQAASPGLGGVWEGTVAIEGQSFRIVFRVDPAGGVLMDSPDQGARSIPARQQAIEGGGVRIEVPSIRGQFEGRLAEDGRTLTGSLSQGGMSIPLVLARTADVAPVSARPQTPAAPFPYRTEEVAFDNASSTGVRLAGTLTLPEGNGPFPAAILITGSGPQDRDETIFNHKPFAVWADALTRRGIAVLRYDDRGVAGSTGDRRTATSADFATDAEAALAWLAARPDIDPRRIGLIGHSEGGLIAPLIVQEGAPAAWVVMLAGPAVSGAEILAEQQRQMATGMGAPPEAVEAGNVTQRALMEIVTHNARDGEAARREVTAYLVGQGQPEAQAAHSAAQITNDWYRWFIAHDPATALTALDVPLLAIYGGRDVQVPAAQNASVLARLNPAAEIVVLPMLNHLLQPATTGQPAEYDTIETTLDATALSTVVEWVAARSSVPAP